MWSRFFTTKYIGNFHLYSLLHLRKGSRFWKGVMALMPKVIVNSEWLIREGKCSFWMDNCLGTGPLMDSIPVVGDLNLKVADVFDTTGPKV